MALGGSFQESSPQGGGGQTPIPGECCGRPLPALVWDLVIAVDSGGDLLFRQGIGAGLVIGDLDSISPRALAFHRERGAVVKTFPADKDLTDFELGLAELPASPANQVHVCGFWGGRLDHAVMNLLVLSRFPGKGLFTFDTEEGWGGVMGPGSLRITLPPGLAVALIALADTHGIESLGVHWPLRDGTLRFGEGRGISNQTREPTWDLGFRSGCLLWLVRGMARGDAGIEWRPADHRTPGPAADDRQPAAG